MKTLLCPRLALTLLVGGSAPPAAAFELLRDIQPGTSSAFTTSEPRLFARSDRLVFFADDGVHGLEPWVSDGTPAGTRRLDETSPPGVTVDASTSAGLSVGERFFFQGRDATSGNEPRATDGAPAGTRLLADLSAGTASPSTLSGYLRLRGGVLWRHAGTLWRSDGTAAGTLPLITAGSTGSTPIDLRGRALWADGTALYLSDGTAAGTVQSGNFEPSTGGILNARGVVNGKAVFVRVDSQTGQEPGVTDGTSGGTMLLKDVYDVVPGIGSSPAILGAIDDWVLFSARDSANTGLWRTDGTPAGTQQVEVINGMAAGVALGRVAVLDGTMYFIADDGVHGRELWRSDGTAAGTYLVKDVEPGASDTTLPRHVYRINRSIAFVADDGVHGPEPWLSDGTAAGTRLWTDVRAGPLGSRPTAMLASGGRAFLVAEHATAGAELHTRPLLRPGRTPLEWCTPVRSGLADLSTEHFDIELPEVQGALHDLDLSLEISHSRVSDLRIVLTHQPTGLTQTLVDTLRDAAANACTGSDLVVRLDDGAAMPLQGQCSNTHPAYPRRSSRRPTLPLSSFAGASLKGPWTLSIEDKVAGHSGTLSEWCLHFTGPTIFVDGLEDS